MRKFWYSGGFITSYSRQVGLPGIWQAHEKTQGFELFQLILKCQFPKIPKHAKTDTTSSARTHSKNNRWHLPGSRSCLWAFRAFLPLLQRVRGLKTTYIRHLASWNPVRLLWGEMTREWERAEAGNHSCSTVQGSSSHAPTSPGLLPEPFQHLHNQTLH